MKNRVEIEEAENGYSIRVWKSEEDDKDDFGYTEPKTFIAATLEEVHEVIKKNFK
jgi:hypothetical protein